MYSEKSIHLTDDLLHEYLDGEQSNEAREVVKQHLDECTDCALRLQTWSVLFVEIGQLSDLELAMDLVPGVIAKLSDHRWRRNWSPWLMVGQSVTALLMMVYGGLQLSGYFPVERIKTWLVSPLQVLEGLFNDMVFVLSDALRNFLAWSPSSSDLIATVPQIPLRGTFYIYLGIALIILWVVGNHYLLRINGHIEDAHP